MSSFALDNDWDLELEDNSFRLTTGADAIAQHLKAKFQLFLGEWFLDTSIGVPYYEDILIKKPSFVVVQEILKDVILETPGVLELETFKIDFDSSTRTFTLEFKVLTTEGEIDFSQEVEVSI